MIAKFLILCVAVGIANAGILKSAAIIAPEIRTTNIITPHISEVFAEHTVKTYAAPIVHKVAAPIVKTTIIEHRPAVRVAVHAAPTIKLLKSAPLLKYASAW